MANIDPNAKWRLTTEEWLKFKELRRRLWMEDFEYLLTDWYENSFTSDEDRAIIDKILSDPEEHLMNMAWYMEGAREDAESDVGDRDLIDSVANDYIKEMIINNNKEGRNETV